MTGSRTTFTDEDMVIIRRHVADLAGDFYRRGRPSLTVKIEFKAPDRRKDKLGVREWLHEWWATESLIMETTVMKAEP